MTKNPLIPNGNSGEAVKPSVDKVMHKCNKVPVRVLVHNRGSLNGRKCF